MKKDEKDNRYGYARCSTSKQDANYEIETLLKIGVPREHIYVEYVSGSKTREQRVEFNKLMTILEHNPGSELFATDFTRIARNIYDMIELIDIVNKYKIKLSVGGFVCDCREGNMDFVSELIIMIFGIIGNFSNKVKQQHTILGMQVARENGKQIGRIAVTKEMLENDPKFLKYYLQWKTKQITLVEMQRLWGVKSRTTCYNNIKIFEGK